MLHRSFKPAKCKTALKLAASRIKLMKNKRAVQVKQLRRELAQLLESGQVQTARIRVEHVVREEKTIAAYDLLEIYCELIAARLPMIESQKNCPIDLKEAIASVIFASPRCDDIPEFKDVRKHLTAKYGKEFASAAVELRPNCGVGRLLVEKLSATAPDGPTKLKILCAIAEEHNVTWDPNKFSEGDSRSTEDLLNGPNTFGKASETLGDLPSVPSAPPNHSDKRSNNVQVSPKSNERHDLPVNFHEQNARSSPRSQTDVGAHKTEQSGVFQPELRPTGSSAARTEFRHPYSGQEQQFSPGSQSWNMEFKDATAAAQAAAESAERASMAARAAAELSSRANGTRQYSTQSQIDEESQRYADPTLRNEHHSKGPVNSAFHEGNSRVNFAQIDSDQQHDVAGNNENFHRENLKSYDRSSRSASLKSNATSVDGNPLGNNFQMADEYSRKNSSELEHTDLLGQVSFKKQSSESEVELVDRVQGGGDTKSVDAYGVRFAKQSSHALSHSQSSMFTDDHDVVSNINSQSLGDDANDNPFATNDDGFVQRKTTKMNPHENAAAVFDDSGSDDDVFNIDRKSVHKEHDYNLEFSSPSIKSPAHVFANAKAWSDVQNANDSRGKSVSQSHLYTEYHSDPNFSESVASSKVLSQSDDMFQATFDDSDGLSSESEEELDNTKLGRSTDTSKYTSYSKTFEMTEDVSPRLPEAKEDAGVGRSTDTNILAKAREDTEILEQSSLDRGTELNFGYLTGGLEKSGVGRSTDTNKHNVYSRASEMTEDAPPRLPEAKEDAESFKESTLDSGTELNFGLLTGGLRNKGNRHLPYKPSPTANASSSKMTAEDTFTKVEESPFASVKASISPGATDQESYNIKVSAEAEKKPSSRSYLDSRDDYFGEELTQHTSKSSQSPFFKKTEIEEDKNFRRRPRVKDFDSDDSDSEDDSPKQVLMRKAPLNNSFSRRTRAPPPNSGKSSYSKTTGLSESLGTPGYGRERNSSSSSLYNTEIRREPQSQSKSSGALGSSEESRLAKQTAYKPNSPAKRSSFEESLKSSAKEEPSNSLRKIEKPDSTRSLKISNKPNSPAKRSSVEESLKSSPKEEPSNSLRKIEKPDSTQSLKISNKPNSRAKRSSFEESLKSSAKEEPSNSLRKIEKPDSTESLKTSSVESPSKERAAHVHPKLPDYDTIAARLQAIRQDRQ